MAKLTLVIGNKNYSSWSLRPWVLLRHFEIPFEEIVIPLKQPDTKEKISKYSPSGKVPVLRADGVTVWESLPICEYLAELFPGKELWPADLKKRAVARSVSGEMYSGFLGLRTNFSLNVSADLTGKKSTDDADRDIKRITQIWKVCREESRKDGDFLFGKFSIADAMYAPVVFRFQTYGIKLEGLASRYFQAMQDLPAMKEWAQAAARETYPWS